MIANVNNLHLYSLPEIKNWAKRNNFKVQSRLNKTDLIRYLQGQYTEKVNGVYREYKPQTRPISCLEPTYADTSIDWLEHLQEYGWAVAPIAGWKQSFVDNFFDFFESCSRNFDRRDPSTWIPDNMPAMGHGILKHYIAQYEFLWEIRELCAPIFAQIWKCLPEELLCSFDGGCFLPTIPKKSDDETFKLWCHIDQNRNDRGFSCVQGIVNFVDNGPEDGGLVLIEDSQKIFDQYMDKHPSYGITWEFIDIDDSLVENKPMIKICAPAGSIILWDSRVMHQNIAGFGSVLREDGTPRYRMCSYVSMQPRIGATEEEIAKRKNLYENGRQTGHNCYGYYFNETAENPNTHGKINNKPPNIEIAALNPLRRKLIGY